MRSRQSNNIPAPQQTSRIAVFFLALTMKSTSVRLCSTASGNFNRSPKPDAYSLSHICFLALIARIFHFCEMALKIFRMICPFQTKPPTAILLPDRIQRSLSLTRNHAQMTNPGNLPALDERTLGTHCTHQCTHERRADVYPGRFNSKRSVVRQ